MDLQKEFEKLQASMTVIISLLTSQKKNDITNDLPDFLSLNQACKVLNLTLQGLHNKRVAGEIRAIAKGNRVYISKEELLRYLATDTQLFNKPRNTRKK